MTCPACRAAIPAGHERCPSCAGIVVLPVVGALAPDPSRLTPPSRGTAGVTALRDVPGLRKREPNWKDEVRARMQKRRKKKSGELPLFDEPASAEPAAEVEPEAVQQLEPEPAAPIEPEAAPPFEAGPRLLGDEPAPADAVEAPRAFTLDEDEPEPLVRDEPAAAEPEEPELDLRPAPEFEEPVAEDEDEPGIEDEWVPRVDVPPTPVERPAPFADRFEAAAVDAGLLAMLYATVIYFASRTAQAELPRLFHAWPWLIGYLAFLGLGYAAWFTGTTGQTPGKMLFNLRVVETDGQPPGYSRALLRAALGVAFNLALGLGALPQFFDPARRALHDRLLRTRVVKF